MYLTNLLLTNGKRLYPKSRRVTTSLCNPKQHETRSDIEILKLVSNSTMFDINCHAVSFQCITVSCGYYYFFKSNEHCYFLGYPNAKSNQNLHYISLIYYILSRYNFYCVWYNQLFRLECTCVPHRIQK